MNRRQFLMSLGIISFSQNAIGDLIKIKDLPTPDFSKTNPQLKPKKQIYLTIDDGVGSGMESILDTLKKTNSHVVFYLIGENLKTQKQKTLAKRAILEGHILGDHSYTHPNFRTISYEKGLDEIKKTNELIETFHEETNCPRTHHLFRFPYGAERKSIRSHLEETGWIVQGWNVDTNDWRYYSKTNPWSASRIMKDLEAKTKDIVLTHDRPFSARNVIPFYTNSPDYKLILPPKE